MGADASRADGLSSLVRLTAKGFVTKHDILEAERAPILPVRRRLQAREHPLAVLVQGEGYSAHRVEVRQEVVIDLGASRTLRGVRYLARQDNGWNGAIRDIEIAVSDTPDAFGDPIVKTALKKTHEPQEIGFAPTTGRYVQIRALSEVNDGPWASAAEIGIVGE